MWAKEFITASPSPLPSPPPTTIPPPLPCRFPDLERKSCVDGMQYNLGTLASWTIVLLHQHDDEA
jgi:hypothetical protein